MTTAVVHVPVRDRNAWAMAVVSVAMIGAFAWIIVAALDQPSPSGSPVLSAPPPTPTATTIPGSVTPVLVLMATLPPTPTTPPTATITRIPNCVQGEATPDEPCQGKPKPNVVTPIVMSTCVTGTPVPEYVVCRWEGET